MDAENGSVASGANGRDRRGRFASGNRAAAGNPIARKVHALRAALLDAVSEGDLRDAVAALIKQAKAGDVHAIRELLDRAVGKPQPIYTNQEEARMILVDGVLQIGQALREVLPEEHCRAAQRAIYTRLLMPREEQQRRRFEGLIETLESLTDH